MDILAPSSPLLSRDAFRESVFARDGGMCVICSAPAVSAHHIIERRLWNDGGYYLDNGASVCEGCHILAEQTVISVETMWAAIGARTFPHPEDLYSDLQIDKWGNLIADNGARYPGPLFYDSSVQKVLRAGGVIDLFIPYFRHPRTRHLPWSEGKSVDDISLTDTRYFEGLGVVVTEKVDGECTSIYRQGFHARSPSSHGDSTRSYIASTWARVGHDIPLGWRVVGENTQMVHSIHYSAIPSSSNHFLVFAIFDEKNLCLDWADTVLWCEMLGLATVPVLYSGLWDEKAVRACRSGSSQLGGEQEGYVIRDALGIEYRHWGQRVGKYVRANHVTTDTHWRANHGMEMNQMEGSE